MKKILAMLFLASSAFAGGFSDMGGLTLNSGTPGQCLQLDGNKKPVGAACSGGGGGSSSLEVRANNVQISSPTATLSFNPAFTGSFISGSTAYIGLNPSSVTLQGVVTAGSLGALTGNQTITLSGDSSGSGATAIAVTNASNQPNIKTLSASSTTITGNFEIDGWTADKGSMTVSGANGLGVTYGVSVGSMTGAGLTNCGSTSQAVSWSNSSNLFGCTTITAAGIGALTGNQTITLSEDASGSGSTAISVTNASNQSNIKTLSASSATVTGNFEVDGWDMHKGSMTIAGGNGLGVTFGVNVGSMTGAGLSTCGDSTHALSWSSTNNQFGCQAISATGGTTILPLPAGATNYIQNTSTLQSGSTAYPDFIYVGSSASVTGAKGMAVKFNVNIGSMTGAGLSNCGDSSHALSWSSTSNQFGCQAITASGAGTTITPLPAGDTTYVQVAGTQTISGSNIFTSTTAFRGGIAISTSPVRSSNYTMTRNDSVIMASGTVTITLPAASTMGGQMVSIMKLDKSTIQVSISIQGTDLIGNTTGLMKLSAPGQSFLAFSDGISNWIPTHYPVQQDLGGLQSDPNSAAAVLVGNDANCKTFTVYDFSIASATWFAVGGQAGTTDVGIYDSSGNRIASSGSQTTPAAGVAHLAYSSLAYLSPGTYWKCLAGSTTTTLTYTRESIDGILGTCKFASSLPLPATLTFSGCTVSTRVFTQAIQFLGGPTQ